jgi:diguanylate cyclase (GGDEF)-like protein
MDLASNIFINAYSIILLVIILFQSLKHVEKSTMDYKLYNMMLQVTILMLVIDILSRLDGKPNTIIPIINHAGNFLIFMLSPILPSIWILFVYNHVCNDEGKIRRLLYPLLAVNAAHAMILLISQYFGWFYVIGPDNVYQRGSLFLLSALFTGSLLIVAFALIILNRKKIGKNHYFSLLFFAVPPLVCIILQIAFYGISLILNSIVLSLLIVFLNIQNHSMHTDYLTGINNRKKLESYLKKKVSMITENKTFSSILIDINNFKSINDTFGHDTGDEVLQISAKLLKSCIKSNDFIARFGGDEFCIIPDSSDMSEVEIIVQRINRYIEKYNETSGSPYKIGFSMGYAVYDYYSGMTSQDFQKHIDKLMYQNKRLNKNISENNLSL